MDVVERAGRLVPGTRVDLLTNQLVVVGRPGGTLQSGRTRRRWPRRPSAASPSATPRACRPASTRGAGSKAAAPGRRCRPRWCRRSPCAPPWRRRAPDASTPAVVYATDAATEPSVPVLYRVPVADAPPIRYPAAVVAGPQQAAAQRFVDVPAVGRGRRPCSSAAGFGLAAVDEPERRSASRSSRSRPRRWRRCWRCRWPWLLGWLLARDDVSRQADGRDAGDAAAGAAAGGDRPAAAAAARPRPAARPAARRAPASRWSSPGRRWCSPWR